MNNEDEISRNYEMATTQNEIIQYCLKDENGYVMTEQAGFNMQLISIFNKIVIVLFIIAAAFIWTYPNQFKKMGDEGIKSAIFFFCVLFFYMLMMIWFQLMKYKKYYLRVEGIEIKKGIKKKLVTYKELAFYLSEWKPIIHNGKIYFVTEQRMLGIEYRGMTSGVPFCMILLKILGEEQITVEDFIKMQQPGHWKEKREAKKELKKRKQYVKNKK